MILRIIAHLAQNHFGQCNMKMQTAINQIQKEADFQGLTFISPLIHRAIFGQKLLRTRLLLRLTSNAFV